MTPSEYLASLRSPARAVDIARVLGIDLDAVYADLVSSEAIGAARVVVTSVRGSMPVCEWEAA